MAKFVLPMQNKVRSFSIILTANSVNHERIKLLLPMLPLARKVGDGLDFPMEEVIEQRQCHLLGRAAVRADVQHVSRGDGAADPHLRIIFISEPCPVGVIL